MRKVSSAIDLEYNDPTNARDILFKTTVSPLPVPLLPLCPEYKKVIGS